jgi:hypothetical protein
MTPTKNGSRILVVKMGGGYLKAILSSDRRESVFGCDEQELAGRLKQRGMTLPKYPALRRKKAT